jgi:hypothetical protein
MASGASVNTSRLRRGVPWYASGLTREEDMKRRIAGGALVLHGLAHVNAGMLASDSATPGAAVASTGPHLGVAVPTALWGAAMIGFVVAGVALAGLAPRWVRWRSWAWAATTSSLALLAMYRPPTMTPAIVIDLALLALLISVAKKEAWDERPVHAVTAHDHRVRRAAHAAGRAVAFAFVGYLAALVVWRPWHMRWGVTNAELRSVLPGDDTQAPIPRYRIDHGVTVNAPPDSVWPWVAQLGQDRAGFYSYDWLERLVGDDIENVNRVVPAWGKRRVGDLVRATQPDYLGGRFGRDIGWRIDLFEPNRVMVLHGWGAFIVQPVGERTTRLIVRTRGDGEPNVVLAPLGFLLFEPAHFIMERGMLLGIKARAEGRVPGIAVGPGSAHSRESSAGRV